MKRIALVASIGLVTVLIFIFLGKSKESTHDEVINPPDEFTPPPPLSLPLKCLPSPIRR